MAEMVSNKSISALLDRMVARDTDYRFMAINDLINGLQADSLRLDSHSEDKVVALVLQLLKDPSGEVQSLAVKALGPLSRRVKAPQVVAIIKELLATMEKSDDEQLKGIYSIGLKTVINALGNATDAAITQVCLKESLTPLLRMVVSHKDDIVRVEACEVLTEIINHFGTHLATHHLDLLDCMLVCLNSPQNTLRKRAIQALGGLAWSIPQGYFASLVAFLLHRLRSASLFPSQASLDLSHETLSSLLAEYPIFQRPHLADQLKQTPGIDMCKTLLQCLNVVARHILRVPNQLNSVLQLVAVMLRLPSTGDSETDDIHELSIQILDTLIRFCPRAIVSTLPELITLLCNRLEYDPNYDYSVNDDNGDMMAVDGGDTDVEDDVDEPEDYSDDEDTSWKVRRAAARALEAIILAYPEKTSDFYVTIAPLLIKRFNDHEEPVRLNVFTCFGTLLRQTRIISSASTATSSIVQKSLSASLDPSVSDFPRSSAAITAAQQSSAAELNCQLKNPESSQSRLLALLPTLCEAIQRQASLPLKRKSHTTSALTRGASGIQHAAFMLNHDLVLALPGHLGEHLNDILNLVHVYSTDPSTNNTVKMDMIHLVVLLFSTHDAQCFRSNFALLVQLALWAMNDSFYRVTLEGLALSQLLSLQIRNLGQEQWAKPLFTTVLALLDSVDRDLELKEKTITSAAVFINQLGDLIGDDLNKSLDVIHRRLNNELTRLSAVRAVHIITVSNHPLNLEVFLPRASDDLATFLSQSDRILRLAALRCLYTVWFKYPRLIGPKCLETVLDLLPRFLVSEQDLQGAQLAIHLVSLLLELGEDDNAELGVRISKFVSADAFNQHLIDLTHSPLLRGQALEAMLRLMRAIGRRSSHHESEQALISFFLSRLLEPLNGGGLLSSSPHRHNGNRTPLSRDALPSLAQCITELLSELPAVSGAKSSFGTLRSVSIAVDRLIAAVKNPDSSPTEIYLNLLILGELGRKTDLGNRTDLREIFISCLLVPTTSASPNNVETPGALGAAITEEVKPAAALGLGRLVVGQPDVLLPFLVDRISQVVAMYVDPGSTGAANQHQLYHMLQALREVIVNLAGFSANDVLKTHLDAIWTLLIASSGVPEEGTRTIVAECLGHLIFVSPRQLIGRLRQQLNSPEANSSPLIRCTLVTAVKFIIIVTDQDVPSPHRTLGQIRLDSLDWPNSVAPYAIPRDESAAANANVTVLEEIDSVLRADHPPPLLDFLTRLADSDMLVRRAALVALNTSAHHRPGLIRPLLNVSLEYPPGHSTTLLKLLYAETAIRPELIREVEMGPFKHKEDDGLDLRKCAFECMSTLLETCLDKLDVSEFLLPLIDGLKDHTDIKLLCYQMVQQIARIRPLEISAKMDALAVPLKTILLSKPKEDWVKQEMEKMQELTRCAISVIVSFKSIDDADKNRFYLDLLRTIEADPSLKPLYANAIAVDSTSGPSPPLYSLYSKRVPYSAYSSLN